MVAACSPYGNGIVDVVAITSLEITNRLLKVKYLIRITRQLNKESQWIATLFRWYMYGLC